MGEIFEKGRKLIRWIVKPLARRNVNPNILTIIGCIVTSGAGLLFACGWFRLAALVLLLGSIWDAIDGEVARLENRVTKFGAYLDSVTDRIAEIAVFTGIIYYYMGVSKLFATLSVVALCGGLLVSYTRARAEGLGVTCKLGVGVRPLRIFLLIAGGVAKRPTFDYIIIGYTLVTYFTAGERIAFTRRKLS